nr:retrovirus-related Pol polyprotein from transposon TNT 1-94 [Tanacetum cinerariifolium]
MKDSELASLFGKLKYEENLIDIIYETEKNKSLVSATPLSSAYFSSSIIQDFQDGPDDEEDTKAKTLVSTHQSPFQPKPLSSPQHKPKIRPTKDFKSKYNKVKAKLALLSSSALASKASMVKKKGLIAEAYEWDKEELSSDDNEMVEVKVLMVLAEKNDAVSKEGVRNNEWAKISMRKAHTLLEMEDNDDKKVYLDYLCIDTNYVEEQRTESFILPNHDTGRILPSKSQRNTTDPSVVVTDSLVTVYDSADESSVYSTLLPPLKKLDAPAKGNKSSSASKVHSAPANKLKNVKIKDDPSLVILMKELNDFKLQISKNQSSHFRNNQLQQDHFSKKRNQPRNTQHVMKCYETCGSIGHTTTDHNYIEWFRIGEELQVKKAEALKSTKAESPNANRSKTPTRRAFENLNWLWHKRLAHLNFKTINKLAKQNLVIGIPLLVYSKDKPCSSCEKGKHHRASFKTKQTSSIKKCLHLLHMDLFGRVTPRSTIVKRHLKTPYEIFCKRNPNIIFLYVFGCPVYIRNHKDHLEKFDEKDDDGYLLGYSLISKAFRVFNTRRQQTEETYHITFDESPDAIKFLKPLEDNINIAETERYPPDGYFHPYEPSKMYQTNSIYVPFIEPYKCPEPVVPETEVSSDHNGQTDQNNHNDQNDQSISKHLSSPSIEDTSVQNPISILTPPSPIPSMVTPSPQDRWSQEKHIELVNIIGNPGARMLIRAMLKQLSAASAHECLFIDFLSEEEPKKQEGLDYDETFASVARLEAIRIFLAFATYMNFILYQMDVKSAFLNGKLKEEVYVKQPTGFESTEFPDHVCKLNKAFYELKQVPRT